MSEPLPDAAAGVHEVVLSLFRNDKPGKILDVGAGEGALTKRLMQAGFCVEPCDLNPERFKIATKKCRKVDLNQTLPYPDEYFDFVSCVEVIEHLRNPWFAVAELARVLKRNGKLIITTPNTYSVHSRLEYMFWGEYPSFKTRNLFKKPSSLYDELDRHINPIWFPELASILRENDLRLQRIATNKYVWRGLKPSTKLAVLIASVVIKRAMIKHYGKNAQLSSDDLLYGQILIIKAEKSARARNGEELH